LCYVPTERNCFYISASDSDSDSSYFRRYEKSCFFSENIFICSRENGDGNFSIEVHEINSEGGFLFKKIQLHTNPERPFDNLFIESVGNSSWKFYISSRLSRETYIIFYDKSQSMLKSSLENEPLRDPRFVERYLDGELDKAVKRVERKLESEVNVLGHVRFSVDREPGTDKWTGYVSLNCYESLQTVFLVQVLRVRPIFSPVIHLLQKKSSHFHQKMHSQLPF
jgi:hypothetical protein